MKCCLGLVYLDLHYQKNRLLLTMKSKKEKTFDAVKMMREIRAKISAETAHMKFEELKKYIDTNLKKNKVKPLGKKL